MSREVFLNHTLKPYARFMGLYSISDAIGHTRLRFLGMQTSCPVGFSTFVIVLTSSHRQHQEKTVGFGFFLIKILFKWIFFAHEHY